MTDFNIIIAQDLKKVWVCVEKDELTTRKKDNSLVRFFKSAFGKLCCCKAPYEDIRLNKVVQEILKKTDSDPVNALRLLKKLSALPSAKKYEKIFKDAFQKLAPKKIPDPNTSDVINVLRPRGG